MSLFRQRATRGLAAVTLSAGLIGSTAAVVFASSASEAGATTPSPCPAPVVSGATATVTCAYTGADQSWTVPAGVTEATFDVYGAQGGGLGGPGSYGGEASATFNVTPGSALSVAVGGSGGSAGEVNDGVFGGGGSSVDEGGGGGASSVETAPRPCSSPEEAAAKRLSTFSAT